MEDNKKHTPQVADWLISKLIRDRYREEFFGDLYELYCQRLETRSKPFAYLMYWVDAIHLLRGFFSPFDIKNENNKTMFLKHYFKLSVRTMLRHKSFSFINIFGLVLGMSTTLLILLYVQYETNYDRYHTHSERIYRISREWLNEDGSTNLHLGTVAPGFAPLIENEFGGIIEQAVRFKLTDPQLIAYEDSHFLQESFFYADADVFKVFSWQFVAGDPATALLEPNTVVITTSVARKYFQDEEALGKVLTLSEANPKIELKVTGVVEDIPSNSHFRWQMLCSFPTFEQQVGKENMMQRWWDNVYATYLLFRDPEQQPFFESLVPSFLDKHLPVRTITTASDINRLHLMPLADIHLRSHTDLEIEPNGNIRLVYLFALVAALILLIACINFMNLSTAKASKRSKEVGVRKVMGAQKTALIQQYFVESLLYALFAMFISLIVVYAALPFFRDLVSKPLTLDFLTNPDILLLILGTTLVTGLVAGSYPALYLSSFQPASILRRRPRSIGVKFNFRSVLVVLQFLISGGLVASVGVIQDQLGYIQKKDPGFNTNDLIVLPFDADMYEQYELIQDRLLSHEGIFEVSLSSRVPSFDRLLSSQFVFAEVEDQQTASLIMADVHVDFDYLPSLGVELAAGRFFDKNLSSDSSQAFIVNEAAVKAIGWSSPQAALGKRLDYGKILAGHVVGVVKDFHYESLRESIVPIIFLVNEGRPGSVLARADPTKRPAVEAFLKEEWSHWKPGFPLSIEYLQNGLRSLYDDERRLSSVVLYFSGLAVLLAALGLFGLSTFMAEQRVKEIGVRKILGARVRQLFYLLTRDFTKLVLVGFLVSIPIAWYFMGLWLSDFAYATAIEASVFIMSGLLMFGVSLIAMSYQVLKVALGNPVEALRYE